jgi:4-amino-4-deoxy-L-arabinose transferase-like glycosyltransferase
MKPDAIIFLVVAMALVVMVRLPWSVVDVLDWDESAYFVVAQDILDGGVPYVTTSEHKGPLLFFILAAVIKVAGTNIFLIRMFTTAVVCCTMLVVYWIGRRLLSGVFSVVPAVACGLFLSNSHMEAMASNSELFMMLPAVAAWYCYVEFRRRQAWWKLFFSGLFTASAILIKPSAFFTVCLIPLAFCLEAAARKQVPALARQVISYAGGAALPCLIFVAYFAVHHGLREFLDIYGYHCRYVSLVPAGEGLINLGRYLRVIVYKRPDPITLLALGSLVFIGLRGGYAPEEKKVVWSVVALTLFSLGGVYLGRRIRAHYFLQMAFPFSLLIGLAVGFMGLREGDLRKLTALFLLFAAAIVFNPRPLQVYPPWETGAPYRAAQYIRAHTGPEDTIFVLGGQPVIYFFAHRRAPVKYFFWLHHTEKYQRVAPIQEEVLAQLDAAKPRYFVYQEDRSGSVPYLEAFMRRNYHLETTLDGYSLYRVNDPS